MFPEAFIEYIMLDPIELSDITIPIPHLTTDDEPVLQAFADRWETTVKWVVPQNSTTGHSEAAANTQLLLIADTDGRQPTAGPGAGLTISHVPDEVSSFVFRGTINTTAHDRHMNADSWAMKTAVHEVTHQWKSNTVWQKQDHCASTTVAYNNSAIYCLMAENDFTRSEAQRDNGIATLHMTQLPNNGPWHSEYLEIRRAPDPFVP